MHEQYSSMGGGLTDSMNMIFLLPAVFKVAVKTRNESTYINVRNWQLAKPSWKEGVFTSWAQIFEMHPIQMMCGAHPTRVDRNRI